MFSISSWLGKRSQPEHTVSAEQSLLLTPGLEDLEQPPGAEPILEQARGMGSYLRNVAISAKKKVSDTMRETAQTIKESVEEHRVDSLLDKTIIGNFRKEQEKFVKEKKSKMTASALPPWAGCNDEETVRHQVLSLSTERRNFLRDPPTGVRFNFDFDKIAPVAIVMLREDETLSKMRFELVPKLVKEEQFWRNYFYRVSLIKQSAQLSSLAACQAENSKDKLEQNLSKSIPATDSTPSKAPPGPMRKQNDCVQIHPSDEISTSPVANEFVSDANDTSSLNQEDFLKGLEQLGMNGGQITTVEDDDIPEWEKELQRELQEFEIVDVKAKVSEAWEKEIEEMLQEED